MLTSFCSFLPNNHKGSKGGDRIICCSVYMYCLKSAGYKKPLLVGNGIGKPPVLSAISVLVPVTL